MILAENRYGKQRVRVLKVFRSEERHTVKELTVSCLLHGDFAAAHYSADNSSVVPTDTVKNTVHVLAFDHLDDNSERFALLLTRHFLDTWPHLSGVDVALEERVWQPLQIGGSPHPHSFAAAGAAIPAVHLQATRHGLRLSSGIKDYLVMKTTASGFAGFPRCALTTLPETSDRIMATNIAAQWLHSRPDEAGPALNATVLSLMESVFSTTWSTSVQRTLYQMGEAVLEALPTLEEIHFALPNKHYLPMDLSAFGRDSSGVVFLPTDEPHGQIEATIRRGTADTPAVAPT